MVPDPLSFHRRLLYFRANSLFMGNFLLYKVFFRVACLLLEVFPPRLTNPNAFPPRKTDLSAPRALDSASKYKLGPDFPIT